MAQGRRCDMGCESWPNNDAYNKCPVCLEDTTLYNNLQPLTEQEATSRVLHLKFDAFYDNHCEERGMPADGPLPWREGDPNLIAYGLDPLPEDVLQPTELV